MKNIKRVEAFKCVVTHEGFNRRWWINSIEEAVSNISIPTVETKQYLAFSILYHQLNFIHNI